MKSKLITMSVVAGVLTGIVAINKNEPRRVAQQAIEDIEKSVKDLQKANAIAEVEMRAVEKKAAEDAAASEKMKEKSGGGVVIAAEIPTEPVVLLPLTVAPAGGSNDYTAVFDCSNGRILIEVHSDWAPLGAKQFKKAINAGVYTQARFYRVISGFMAQIGIPADPALAAEWKNKSIMDEPVKVSNTLGRVTFAKSRLPNSRTAQIFINYGNNASLDKDGFAPFGEIIEGMDVALSLYAEYGAKPGNEQGLIQTKGNAYLKSEYPKLDYVKKITIVKPGGAIPPAEKKEGEAETAEVTLVTEPSE